MLLFICVSPGRYLDCFVCLFGALRRIDPCGLLATDGIKLNMVWIKKVKDD